MDKIFRKKTFLLFAFLVLTNQSFALSEKELLLGNSVLHDEGKSGKQNSILPTPFVIKCNPRNPTCCPEQFACVKDLMNFSMEKAEEK